jgi:hypothetical protein
LIEIVSPVNEKNFSPCGWRERSWSVGGVLEVSAGGVDFGGAVLQEVDFQIHAQLVQLDVDRVHHDCRRGL